MLFRCACFGRAFRSVLSLRPSHVVFPSSRDLLERSVTRRMRQMTRNRWPNPNPVTLGLQCTGVVGRVAELTSEVIRQEVFRIFSQGIFPLRFGQRVPPADCLPVAVP